MKRFILISCVLFGLLCASNSFADTGTYRILDYKVTLTPHSSGEVDIDYYQKWLVTGGHIPWITVGVPNADFTIMREKCKGAIAEIRSANEGSWRGIRLDLDKDYRPDETFEIWFSISQRGLFYANDTDYRLDFTPGWYDRAAIDNLTIEIISFAALNQVKASPEPLSKEGQKIAWGRKDLRRGERFTAGISFPRTLVAMTNVRKRSQRDNSGLMLLLAILSLVTVIAVIRKFHRLKSKESSRYSGGVYSHGGAFGGRRWLGGWGLSGGRGHSRLSGGGGGFGGAGFSCACACAGCACACACAGGGGAGCSRKIDHICPLCSTKNEKSMERVWPVFLGFFVLLNLASCNSDTKPYDTNTQIEKGEPAFIPLTQYWIIDGTGLVAKKTIVEADKICQQLKEDGIAEVVVLIQNRIKEPDKYATHYGRWLKLGRKGLSTEGGNNGIIWLIRPGAKDRISISVGRGLPKFTSIDYGEIIEKAKDYVNFNNFDEGVLLLVKETDKKLREIYSPKGG
jgi:uncharacterized membrane protein YgcG